MNIGKGKQVMIRQFFSTKSFPCMVAQNSAGENYSTSESINPPIAFHNIIILMSQTLPGQLISQQ